MCMYSVLSNLARRYVGEKVYDLRIKIEERIEINFCKLHTSGGECGFGQQLRHMIQHNALALQFHMYKCSEGKPLTCTCTCML